MKTRRRLNAPWTAPLAAGRRCRRGCADTIDGDSCSEGTLADVKSGFVSFLGRPNAGKSTLLNRIVGHKLAIVSDKPQTTRTRIVGAKNYEAGQAVFVDTPGI